MTEHTGVLAVVEASCAEMERHMKMLRWGIDIPQGTDPEHGGDVHRALLAVRARLDSAEQLIRAARHERARFRAKAAQRRQEADDEFDRLLVAQGEGAVRQEWQGGREREAKARALNLDKRRVARKAETASAMVDDCYEGLRDAFFGLLNVREELLARMRELQWASALEHG